jgi:muramidase (phage lysozyme)
MRAALVGAAGLIAVGAWVLLRQSQGAADQAQQAADEGWYDWQGFDAGGVADVVAGAGDAVADVVDAVTMGIFSLGAMSRVTADDVANPNVRALLAVIRRGEGTAGPDGYRTLFGGGLFESFAGHPRKSITRKLGSKTITSTAAGAYQFLASTWDETAARMKLRDFTPASQDRAAVGRIAARGALDDARAGRLDAALSKVAREWASMPGSPYGQPVISVQTARAAFVGAGGVLA